MFYGYTAYTFGHLLLKFLILLSIALLTDIYLFRKFRNYSKRFIKSAQISLSVVYWAALLVLVVFVVIFICNNNALCGNYKLVRWYALMFSFFILIYIPKLIFALLSLLNDFKRIFSRSSKGRLLVITGWILSLFTFLLFLSGLTVWKDSIVVKEVTIPVKNLPSGFDGYRIVQLSDIHLGSFYNTSMVKRIVEKTNEQNPDVVVFTGDLVNFTAAEAVPYIKILQDIRAPKYAILGNHDFGDYALCYSQTMKDSNVKQLVGILKSMGFITLYNQNAVLIRQSDSLYLTGVNNWGHVPYKQYADLSKALAGIPENGTKILLSHDPEHWEEVVKYNKGIALTLSGHIHGMQFGIITKYFQWSPIKAKYPHWAGLYHHYNSYLYINNGLGVVGFLGRVGIRPEITVVTLKKN